MSPVMRAAILAVVAWVAQEALADEGSVHGQIRREASRPNTSDEERPLPLACSWQCGEYPGPSCAGWRPENQIALIEQGYHLLPWFGHPAPGPVPTDRNDFFFAYYESAIKRARQLRLPLTLIASQWESGLSQTPYIDLPSEDNPNVVAVGGKTLPQVSPFGPVKPWREIGKKRTDHPRMRQLQEWYPDPPVVIFLSNNEHSKLAWISVETDERYLARHGKGRDDDFKRNVVGDGWIERYRALQEGMRTGLSSPQWKKAAVFVGYDAFGPPHFGRWNGWPEYSLHAAGRIAPDPLTWDGGSPSYYTHNWNPSTDYTVWSPQVEFQNLVFMQDQAYRLNPEFWFELSIWDGYAPSEPNDKRKHYADRGQSFTPERYAGFVQFGMWLTRPRAVREFRGWTQPWDENKAFFLALVASVDRVHDHPVLREFWRKGNLVANPARRHPYQAAIPAEYAASSRWFLLDADVNPKGDAWTPQQAIAVYALALVQGVRPTRRWLVYAHSPMEDRRRVQMAIPEYGPVIVRVARRGSFHRVEEQTGSVTPLP